MVKQLRNFFGGLGGGLMFRGHPDFRGFFDDLFTDRVHPFVQERNGAATGRSLCLNNEKFRIQLVESFHCPIVTV